MVHLRSLFFEKRPSDAEKSALHSYRKSGISSIIWILTHRCNLRCRHCYADAGPAFTEELSTKEAFNVIEQLDEVGKPLLFLTGGEPLTRDDVYDIMRETVRRGIRTILSTNGTLITPSVADRLKEIGIHYVMVPLYGPEKFHDFYTQVKGSYEKVINAVKELKERNIRFGFKTVVTKNTYKHILSLFDLAYEYGASLVYICDLITSGRGVSLKEERLSKKEWQLLMDQLIHDVLLNEKYANVEIDIGAHPSTGIYALKKMEELGYDVSNAIEKMSAKRESAVGQGFLSISPKGDILLTNFLQELTIGNIREKNLLEAINHPLYKKLGNSDNLKGTCGKCVYRHMCGGSRAKAYLEYGDILAEDPTCLVFQ